MEQLEPYDDLMGKSHSERRPTPQPQLKGDVILNGNAGYEEARRVWNGAIDKKPAMIAYCLDAEDVIEAVTFARSRTFPVAVRSGGHNVAGL
jgi:FAD/FMN-containing dehydrogenase